MSRKLLNEVDGFIVDEFQGTFTGTFDVRGADAKYLAYDDEVLVVVKARVKPPRLKELKNGDIVRVNVLQVREGGVVRSDELKAHLCETLGMDVVSPQLTFDSVLELAEVADEPEPEVFSPGTPADSPELEGFIQTDVEPGAPPTGATLKVQKFRTEDQDDPAILAGFLGT